jgi:predicted methyltransferase
MLRICLTAAAAILNLYPMSVGAAHGTPAVIAKAVADPTRSLDQVVTDEERKPAETLTFAGVRRGMVVGEFFPGGVTLRKC